MVAERLMVGVEILGDLRKTLLNDAIFIQSRMYNTKIYIDGVFE
jgi:hypothetical protein